MKLSFIVPARNKAAFVGRCVESVLAQTLDDMEFVISDQGSEDGTLDEIWKVVSGYHGEKVVRVLRCPETHVRGRAGLNAHLNWLHNQVEGDIVVACSADDWNHPDRAIVTKHLFELYNPSFVNTKVQFVRNGASEGETYFPDRYSRWIAMAEGIKGQIGSSGSSAWARDLFTKYGPLRDLESEDVLLPIMAMFERGLYYVDTALHMYEWHADLDNTGVMGQQLAARDDAERRQLAEVGSFHAARNWLGVMQRVLENGFEKRMSVEARDALQEKVLGSCGEWVRNRVDLTLARIEPQNMRT